LFVRENEERVAKEEIERESEWGQNGNRAPEGGARELQIRARGKPPGEASDRDEKKQEATGVTERGRIGACRLEDYGMQHRAQGEGGGQNEQGRDRQHHQRSAIT